MRFPGPVLRLPEGRPVTVDVVNQTSIPELVHWHGMFIPPEVDGSAEEGTPMVPPRRPAALSSSCPGPRARAGTTPTSTPGATCTAAPTPASSASCMVTGKDDPGALRPGGAAGAARLGSVLWAP